MGGCDYDDAHILEWFWYDLQSVWERYVVVKMLGAMTGEQDGETQRYL